MSVWLALVIVGQFLNAVVALVDKYVITSHKIALRPLSYAFYVSVLSFFSVVIFFLWWIPLPAGLSFPSVVNIHVPTLMVGSLSIVAGFAFFTGLVSLFTALKEADASDAIPVVGGVSAVATLLLSALWLDATLSHYFLLGFILLVSGTVLVSQFRFSWRTILATIHAGIFFALHSVVLKALFEITSFDNAFFWSRIAIGLVALSTLLIPVYYKNIREHTKNATGLDGFFVIGNKILAGLASIIVLKAISLGDVSLIQALGGLQFVFLLIFGIFFGRYTSVDCGENLASRDIGHKLISIPLIIAGFFMLFL